ncbi:hypothetical protein AOLI_G00012830 [Acnodon oligacanthus]
MFIGRKKACNHVTDTFYKQADHKRDCIKISSDYFSNFKEHFFWLLSVEQQGRLDDLPFLSLRASPLPLTEEPSVCRQTVLLIFLSAG